MADQQKQTRDAQLLEKNKFESLQLERETLLGQLTKLAQVLKQQKDYYEKQVKALEQSLSETTRLKEEASNKKDKKSCKNMFARIILLQALMTSSETRQRTNGATSSRVGEIKVWHGYVSFHFEVSVFW